MYYNEIIEKIKQSNSLEDLFVDFNFENYMDCTYTHRQNIFSKIYTKFSQKTVMNNIHKITSLFLIFFDINKNVFNNRVSNNFLSNIILAFKDNREQIISFSLHNNLLFKILDSDIDNEHSVTTIITKYIKKNNFTLDELYHISQFANSKQSFPYILFDYVNHKKICDFFIYKNFYFDFSNHIILAKIKQLNIYNYYHLYNKENIFSFIENFVKIIEFYNTTHNISIDSHLEFILSILDYEDFYFNVDYFQDPKIAQKIIDYKKLKDNITHF